MAQLVAQRFRNAMVGCSSHSFGVKIKLGLTKVNSFFILYLLLENNTMKYNLSRQPGTYEYDRESFAFNINSKVYDAREYSFISDQFWVLDSKKLDKFLHAVYVFENRDKCVNDNNLSLSKASKIADSLPLYNGESIPTYEHNQKALQLWTKLVIRKLIIGYLKKQENVEVVKYLTDEKKLTTMFVIRDYRVLKDLYDYFYDLYVNKYVSYEDMLNSNISKIGKTNYLMPSTDKYEIDLTHPIEFTNIADGLDCANVYTAFLNMINRIKQIFQQIEMQEQEQHKKFKAVVVWTV